MNKGDNIMPNNEKSSTVVSTGISMGTALAMILSYTFNESILWAILHGICSWFYVIYFAIVH